MLLKYYSRYINIHPEKRKLVHESQIGRKRYELPPGGFSKT